MISIELISRGEPYLADTLESIREQSYNNYEVVCADSSGKGNVEKILDDYGCKTVILPEDTLFLSARYHSHLLSKGEFCLILDSTRPLRDKALELLSQKYSSYDMTIIRENSIGKGFWVEQARKLSEISLSEKDRLKYETLAFLLPRFYKKEILDRAFTEITRIVGDLFDKIGYGEHHLIFEAGRKFGKSVGLTDEPLIDHFEDDSLAKILKKYHRYGKSQRVLKLIGNTETRYFNRHIRKNIDIRKRLSTVPISIARSIPFLIGYLLF